MENARYPKVSFIIPTFNSEKTLGSCLESIVKQDYPDIEIIIVDGYSSDSTLRIASRYPTRVIFANGLLGKARQIGAVNSTGKILAIFDSDIILPSTDWLKKAVVHFLKDSKVGIVWPINKAPPHASCVTRCYFNMWDNFIRNRVRRDRTILPGGNSLVNRSAFIEAGGFNPGLHYGEDFDLMRRIINKGYKVVVCNPIYHNTMRSLKEFTRKQLTGARTLLKRQGKGVNLDLLYMCSTWDIGREHLSLFYVMRRVFVDHIIIGLRGMFIGIFEDKSWLLFPLLLAIRIFVYTVIFIITLLGK
jgi:glycosyltransferase involved in cell wall biosynthesis